MWACQISTVVWLPVRPAVHTVPPVEEAERNLMRSWGRAPPGLLHSRIWTGAPAGEVPHDRHTCVKSRSILGAMVQLNTTPYTPLSRLERAHTASLHMHPHFSPAYIIAASQLLLTCQSL